MALRPAWLLAALLFPACLFDTRAPDGKPVSIRPSFPEGGQWMYQYREYTGKASGPGGDTAIRYIRYSRPGDTLIAGVTYELLVEEDLAFYNADQGLVLNRIAFGMLASGDTLRVKQLRNTANIAGRLPLKAAASFDTAHFEDEITVLLPIAPGRGWELRPKGHPLGRPRAYKTYLGMDSLDRGGFRGAAFLFDVALEGFAQFRIREWYSSERKVFSRTAYATTPGGPDSSVTEEEYLGARGFTGADTSDVLRSAARIRDAQ
jgi:hypothetical protein